MGTCFSLEGGGGKRIAPAQRSQIPDSEHEQIEPTVPSEPVIIPVPASPPPVIERTLEDEVKEYERTLEDRACTTNTRAPGVPEPIPTLRKSA